MSGYVASIRVVRASPRLVAGRPGELSTASIATIAPAATDAAADAAIVEADGSSVAAVSRLSERLRAFRDRWSQLTFFLFDPDSWRT